MSVFYKSEKMHVYPLEIVQQDQPETNNREGIVLTGRWLLKNIILSAKKKHFASSPR